jgi:hypothetical protein
MAADQLSVLVQAVGAFAATAGKHSGGELFTWAVVLVLVAVVVRALQGPRGRGGSRSWYRDRYLRSPLWRARRARALALAGSRCERCGRAGRLDVHHATYKRLGRERDGDLHVLCRDCHEDEHHPLRRLVRGLWRVVRRAFATS